MPGSGRSTVCRVLAARLGRPFFDLDDEIEAASELPIPALFRRHCDTSFRDLESRIGDIVRAPCRVLVGPGRGLLIRVELFVP